MSTSGERRQWRVGRRSVLISAAITVVMAATLLAVTGHPQHPLSAHQPVGSPPTSSAALSTTETVAPIMAVTSTTVAPTTTTAAPTTTVASATTTTTVRSPAGSLAPASPPVTWCESGFSDPYASPPPGAVTVPAGDNSSEPFMANYTARPNTTYWFAPGTHKLGSGLYAQIKVDDGDNFVGAPGAVIDGGGVNDYAFTENAAVTTSQKATIEYLTIKDFLAGAGEAVVGQGGYTGWTVKHDLVEDNPYGAGVDIGSAAIVADNCLTDNGEYGYTAFGNEHDVTFTGNDVSDSNQSGPFG